jgi:hypothetical protein
MLPGSTLFFSRVRDATLSRLSKSNWKPCGYVARHGSGEAPESVLHQAHKQEKGRIAPALLLLQY